MVQACREEAWELIRPDTDKPRRPRAKPSGTPAVRQRTEKWFQSPASP